MTARLDTGRSLPDRQRLGAELRTAREAIGLTQVDLAGIAQIRPCTVSYIENATRDALISSAVDHAAATGRRLAVAGGHHLPLLTLTADEVAHLWDLLVGAAAASPYWRRVLDKLTTTEETDHA